MLADEPGSIVLPLGVVDVAVLGNIVCHSKNKKVQAAGAAEARSCRTLGDGVFHTSAISALKSNVLARVAEARLIDKCVGELPGPVKRSLVRSAGLIDAVTGCGVGRRTERTLGVVNNVAA